MRNIFKDFRDHFEEGAEEILGQYKQIDLQETCKKYWGEMGAYHVFNDFMQISMIVPDEEKIAQFKDEFNLIDDDYILVVHPATGGTGLVVEPKDHELLFKHFIK